MEIIMNENIKKIIIPAEKLNGSVTRNCFEKVCSFIDNKRCFDGRIFSLYGLRRSGRSYLLSQINEKYKNTNHVAFFEFPTKDKNEESLKLCMDDVYDLLDECLDNEVSIVLLDEITNIEDFAYDSEILADHYAKRGLSIIISGTDSLGLILAGNGPLLGRKPEVAMSYISFAEYSHVLGVDSFDDYIKYGGLLHDVVTADDDMVKDIVSLKRYLESAVAGNITRSLKNYMKYNKEITHYEEVCNYSLSDISQIINKFVEDYSGIFEQSEIDTCSIDDITKCYLKKFRRDFNIISKKQFKMARESMTLEYAQKINIECNLTKPATSELIRELENLLFTLRIVSTIDVCLYTKIDNKWSTPIELEEYHIIQPSIKYYQLQEAKNNYIGSKNLDFMNDAERKSIAQRLEEKILDDMAEKIIQFDTQNCLDKDRYSVCKSEFSIDNHLVGDYDMIIYDSDKQSYYGFEINHTDTAYIGFNSEGIYDGQDKNLLNNELRAVADDNFGKRERVFVLYNGKSFNSPTGTTFLNISTFLKSIDKTHDIEATCEDLCKNIPDVGLEVIQNNSDNTLQELLAKNKISFNCSVKN